MLLFRYNKPILLNYVAGTMVLKPNILANTLVITRKYCALQCF